ncbi:SDR family NAD(P)-dependent oxidoreductase [Agreia bicolorata]
MSSLGCVAPLVAAPMRSGAGARRVLVELRKATKMRSFTSRVAVVTGGASGIGRAMVDRFAHEGMKVVLADVEQAALDRAVSELRAAGAEAIGVRTDVTDPDQVQNLADRAVAEFGAVHVLCNNAGVEGGALFSEMSEQTWKWVFDVNFWGPLYGCRAFLPILRQQEEAHIVTTASQAAFATGLPTFHAYVSSKAAVASMTANLERELSTTDPHVGVSLLVPGLVKTRMNDSERNRPAGVPATDSDDLRVSIHHNIERATEKIGMAPEDVAQLVLDGIRERRFYLLTHPDMTVAAVEAELSWLKGGPAPTPPADDAVQNPDLLD